MPGLSKPSELVLLQNVKLFFFFNLGGNSSSPSYPASPPVSPLLMVLCLTDSVLLPLPIVASSAPVTKLRLLFLLPQKLPLFFFFKLLSAPLSAKLGTILSAPDVPGRPEDMESADDEFRSLWLRLKGRRRKTLLGLRGDLDEADGCGDGAYGDGDADAEAS